MREMKTVLSAVFVPEEKRKGTYMNSDIYIYTQTQGNEFRCARTHTNTPIHTVECLKDCVFPSLGGMPSLLELPVFTS